jgi:hypothetical protein
VKKNVVIVVLVLFPSVALAHQPVMDMAPRWSGGYGFQTRTEYAVGRRLEENGSRVSNPQGLKSESYVQWWEGVYTFDRSVRVTVKLPYEEQRKRFSKNGVVFDETASGVGDVILTVPLKYYRDTQAYASNFAFNPSVTLPTGKTGGALPLGRGTVDYGLSFSSAREAPDFFGLWDVWTKVHTRGKEGKIKGNILGFDMNLGLYPYRNKSRQTSVLFLWSTHARHSFRDRLSEGGRDGNSGGPWVEMAPLGVLLHNNLSFQVGSYFPVYQKFNGTQVVNAYRIQLMFGLTF